MTTELQTGGCLCGKVRYTLNTRAEKATVCHCSMCRKWTGGVNIAFSADAADTEITGTEHVKWHKSSEWASRGFCAECGSSLFYRLDAEVGAPDEGVSIAFGSLDDPGAVPVTAQIYIDEKPGSYVLAGDTLNLTGAEFRAKYADQGG